MLIFSVLRVFILIKNSTELFSGIESTVSAFGQSLGCR